MPEISRFLGISISMYYREHDPPYFHVKYGEHRGAFSIREMSLIEGAVPGRVVALVLEWALEHRAELLEDWELARRREPLKAIQPLV